jgi:hypothetical protein
MRRFAAVLSLPALLAFTATAQNPNLGTSGAQFLKIPAGARAAAMAGAVVGSVQDASALFWNPAGIVNVTTGDLHASYTPWWATVRLSHAAVVYTTESSGSFGVSVSMLGMDEMEMTTELEPDGNGVLFDAADLMLGLSYARRLTDQFSVGVTAKYVNQRIWNETASGIAFDVGTQYRIGYRDLTLAMSMQNFGPDMRYDGRDLNVKYDPGSPNPSNRLAPARLTAEDYPLPLLFQVGLSMTAVTTDEFSLLAEVDVVHPNDNRERINVGGELTILKILALRGGYRFNYDAETATFGAGLNVPLGSSTLRVDYAYALYDLLPDVSRLSVGFSF